MHVDRIEAAMALAEAETGVWSATRLRVCVATGKRPAARRWTAEEDKFLRANLDRIAEEEIARHLRRTRAAVHIRWGRELHLPAPSKGANVITAEQVAIGLGEDGKSIHMLIDRGIMPGRRLLGSGRVIRLVDRIALVKWILDPEHWAYFHPDRVGALRPQGKRRIAECFDFAFWEDVRRLVEARRRSWKDEWMTPGQVKMLLRVGDGVVNRAILAGNLKATRWGNWMVKRSDLRPGKILNSRGEWVTKIRRTYPFESLRCHGKKTAGPRLTCKQMEILRELRRVGDWILPVRLAEKLGRGHLGSAWSCPTLLLLVRLGLAEKKGWYYRAKNKEGKGDV